MAPVSPPRKVFARTVSAGETPGGRGSRPIVLNVTFGRSGRVRSQHCVAPTAVRRVAAGVRRAGAWFFLCDTHSGPSGRVRKWQRRVNGGVIPSPRPGAAVVGRCAEWVRCQDVGPRVRLVNGLWLQVISKTALWAPSGPWKRWASRSWRRGGIFGRSACSGKCVCRPCGSGAADSSDHIVVQWKCCCQWDDGRCVREMCGERTGGRVWRRGVRPAGRDSICRNSFDCCDDASGRRGRVVVRPERPLAGQRAGPPAGGGNGCRLASAGRPADPARVGPATAVSRYFARLIRCGKGPELVWGQRFVAAIVCQ